jgi:hypothetical protein
MPVNPVMVHADGTDCNHEGPPQARDGGVACPAGQLITHVRVNGKPLTLAEACAALQSVAEAWTHALTPLVTAMAAWAQSMGSALWASSPAIRALAAACAVVDEERERYEQQRGEGPQT